VRHLAFYNADMQFVVEPGEIGVLIGASSEDIRAQASFTIVGEVTPVEQVFTTRVSIE
jgi:beta-glucosidase